MSNKNTITDEKLWKILKENAPKSVTWNHYDLAELTEIKSPEIWKKFLTKQDVIDWLQEEQAILQRYELTKLSTDVSNSRSVGQAQLISAMERVNATNENKQKKGPIFVYCYVPLNKNQQQAENVTEAPYDIFLSDSHNNTERTDDDGPNFDFT